jgi:hypothetical protein
MVTRWHAFICNVSPQKVCCIQFQNCVLFSLSKINRVVLTSVDSSYFLVVLVADMLLVLHVWASETFVVAIKAVFVSHSHELKNIRLTSLMVR